MRGYNLTDLTPIFGTSIDGLDTSQPLSTHAASELMQLLDTRGLVVVRKQQLTAERFMALAQNLGTPVVHPLNGRTHGEMPALMLHSNIIDNGKPIGYAGTERQWRMDGAQLATPWRASLAYAVEVPMQDGMPLGATSFASTRAAFDALAPGLRQQLAGLRAVHPYGTGRKRRATPYFADSGLTQIFKRGIEHPVLRAHPRTRRPCLYVSEACTSHICGLNDGDSARLLDELFRHLAQAQFTHVHHWQPGDLVLWDNCATQYRTADNYALPQRRLLYRTQLKGP